VSALPPPSALPLPRPLHSASPPPRPAPPLPSVRLTAARRISASSGGQISAAAHGGGAQPRPRRLHQPLPPTVLVLQALPDCSPPSSLPIATGLRPDRHDTAPTAPLPTLAAVVPALRDLPRRQPAPPAPPLAGRPSIRGAIHSPDPCARPISRQIRREVLGTFHDDATLGVGWGNRSRHGGRCACGARTCCARRPHREQC
jgi:hypothetical protein